VRVESQMMRVPAFKFGVLDVYYIRSTDVKMIGEMKRLGGSAYNFKPQDGRLITDGAAKIYVPDWIWCIDYSHEQVVEFVREKARAVRVQMERDARWAEESGLPFIALEDCIDDPTPTPSDEEDE
jgi:hypothetical protein